MRYVEKYGTAGQATGENIIRRMRLACWIIKATDAHSECVTIISLPWQKLLLECASILRYAFIACPVLFSFL